MTHCPNAADEDDCIQSEYTGITWEVCVLLCDWREEEVCWRCICMYMCVLEGGGSLGSAELG